MEIYISRDGQQLGPYSPSDVKQYLKDGSLKRDDLAWCEGCAEWMPLVKIPGLSISSPPPSASSSVDTRQSAVEKPVSFDFKNAEPADLKAEYNRIAKEIGDDQFFTKKELNHLPQILADGEQVLAFSSGLMNNNTWLITLTDRRIIFLDKGLIYGLKQTTIDLDKINALSGETGLFFGKIRIQDGATERHISMVWKKTVIKFTNKTRDAMEARKRMLQAPISVKTDDVVSKLEKLAVLREKGILSQQEFEQQKAKLIAE